MAAGSEASDPPVIKNAGKLTCAHDCGPMPDWVNNPLTLGGGLIAAIAPRGEGGPARLTAQAFRA